MVEISDDLTLSQEVAVMQAGTERAFSPLESRDSCDRAGIAALAQRMVEAWDAGDGARYGELFTGDCDYVAFDGTHLKGREQNALHHEALYRTVLKGSRLAFEGKPQIRFLSADIAVMHAMGSVLLPWQDRVTPRRRSYQNYVVVRGTDDCWRITAFHNTRYRPLRFPTGFMLRVIIFFMRLRTAIARRAAPGARRSAR
jgi:uncharacterized protein (TIGR02246 family)